MQKHWYQSAIGRFRIIGNAEAISFLFLLFIAMPLKYFAGIPSAVLVTGWIHGLFFITYIIAVLYMIKTYHWNIKKSFFAIFAAVIPFGPFIFDRMFLRIHGQ